MLRGRTVTVMRPTGATSDRFGNQEPTGSAQEKVGNVLIAPADTSDLEAAREDGTTVALEAHFPRGYGKELEGCEVVLDGQWAGTYRVVGDPKPYDDALTPTAWDMPVRLVSAHG